MPGNSGERRHNEKRKSAREDSRQTGGGENERTRVGSEWIISRRRGNYRDKHKQHNINQTTHTSQSEPLQYQEIVWTGICIRTSERPPRITQTPKARQTNRMDCYNIKEAICIHKWLNRKKSISWKNISTMLVLCWSTIHKTQCTTQGTTNTHPPHRKLHCIPPHHIKGNSHNKEIKERANKLWKAAQTRSYMITDDQRQQNESILKHFTMKGTRDHEGTPGLKPLHTEHRQRASYIRTATGQLGRHQESDTTVQEGQTSALLA